MEHTPAPWEIDTSGKVCARDCIRHNGIVIALIGHNSGGYIRKVDVDKQEAEEDANAHLIAAAPDLLASLVERVEAADLAWSGFETVPDWLTRDRALIAKARGAEKPE